MVQFSAASFVGAAAEDLTEEIIVAIETGDFAGRYEYEAEFFGSCQFVLRELPPNCPDQLKEVVFSLQDVNILVDTYENSIRAESIFREEVIEETVYFFGNDPKGRRFCRAPARATLNHGTTTRKDKTFLYGNSSDVVEHLADLMVTTAEACRANDGASANAAP